VRCIWCDDPNHRRSDCGSYADALKEGIVTFKERRIRDATTDEPLGTNFGRGGIKKLLEEKLGKTSFIHAKRADTYHIEAGQSSMEASSNTSREVMIRGAQAIRRLTGWDDPMDITTIKAYLVGDHGVDMSTETSVEGKRGRAAKDKEAEEPASKKRPPSGRAAAPVEGPANRTRQREETGPSTFHLRNAPLPKDKWEERMSKEKRKGKEDVAKGKRKTPAYKLQSNIESSIDLKGIQEERIQDAKIEFTLREALSIAKKDFYELIIDIIKRKRQMTVEIVMTKAMDTRMTEDEEEEIGQVFALMCDCVDGQDKGNETISSQVHEESGEEMEEFMDDEMESEILQMFSYSCVNKIRVEPRANKNQQDEEV
jgi:hypothetical protein